MSRLLLGAALSLASVLGTAGCGGSDENRERPQFLTDSAALREATHEGQSLVNGAEGGRFTSPVTLDDETRLALKPSLPGRFSFELSVPSEPVLRFAIGVAPAASEGTWPPVEFQVLVAVDGESELVFTESLDHAQAGQWLDREIGLSRWSRRSILLVFETNVRGPESRVRRAGRRVIPLWGSPVVSSGAYRRDRPNLVLISIDCLRADHVSAYGYFRPTTPNIDALAADGTVFEAAASVSSWTLPTHLSMLTGLMPSLHGVRTRQRLGAEVAFLPEILRDAGYQVDGVASWYFLSQGFGFDRGFHSYRLLVGHGAEDVIDAALDTVRRSEGREQFLFLHLVDPHWPYLAPDGAHDRFGRPADISSALKRVNKREAPDDPSDVEGVIRLYDAEIAYADEHLGRFFSELKSRGLYDDALIIVTADHGEAFYEHGHWEHTLSLYGEVTHIPLIVKWPRGRHPRRVSSPVSQIDVFPTILEAAGLASPETGALSLSNHAAVAPADRGILSELTSPLGRLQGCRQPPIEGGECVAVRLGRLKLIASLVAREGELHLMARELYDIGTDPKERQDLSDQEPEAVQRMMAIARSFLTLARNQRASGEPVDLDEETMDALRSLGYVQ
jgi:arylsulfatase A-like enzyme